MPGLLHTDGYKFSMAEAGFPLRQETFYYSHRRAGPHYLPFDVEAQVRALLPSIDGEHYDFLASQGYGMGGAFRHALEHGDVVIHALPAGSWFFDREPVFTVTGPSALVSWLEPLVLQLHHRIQVATLAMRGEDQALAEAVAQVPCSAQRDAVLETLDALDLPAPPVAIDSGAYQQHVLDRVRALVDLVEDPARIFEVGMRAASSHEQHLLALQACQEAGVLATSNVAGAHTLGLRAVGTMGHEHVQRHGSDEAAFRAMRDRHPGATSFLLDTFSTLESGLPTALRLIAEAPLRRDSVRFDSGDIAEQFRISVERAAQAGVRPCYILEDGFNRDKTARFEGIRRELGLPMDEVLYGYGGHIVKAPGDPLTRDRVAAVWKLTQSGPNPAMKFGDEPGGGKESLPGRPRLARSPDGHGAVVQADEPHDGIDAFSSPPIPMSAAQALAVAEAQGDRPAASPRTASLVAQLRAARDARTPRR